MVIIAEFTILVFETEKRGPLEVKKEKEAARFQKVSRAWENEDRRGLKKEGKICLLVELLDLGLHEKIKWP